MLRHLKGHVIANTQAVWTLFKLPKVHALLEKICYLDNCICQQTCNCLYCSMGKILATHPCDIRYRQIQSRWSFVFGVLYLCVCNNGWEADIQVQSECTKRVKFDNRWVCMAYQCYIVLQNYLDSLLLLTTGGCRSWGECEQAVCILDTDLFIGIIGTTYNKLFSLFFIALCFLSYSFF